MADGWRPLGGDVGERNSQAVGEISGAPSFASSAEISETYIMFDVGSRSHPGQLAGVCTVLDDAGIPSFGCTPPWKVNAFSAESLETD